MEIDREADQHLALKSLTHALLNFARIGKRVVVCLDDPGHAARKPGSAAAAHQSETEKRKLMQVVLFGQPELDERLKERSVRQLRQRISFQHRLGGLRKDEVDLYLSHRLNVAGYQGGRLFSKGAVALLHRHSGGTPASSIFLLTRRCCSSMGEGGQQILPRHVGRRRRYAGGALAGGALGLGGRDHARRVGGRRLGVVSVSVINQVLQDLEKRGVPRNPLDVLGGQVRAVPGRPGPRWPFTAVAAAIAVAVGGWIWRSAPLRLRSRLIISPRRRAPSLLKFPPHLSSRRRNPQSLRRLPNRPSRRRGWLSS